MIGEDELSRSGTPRPLAENEGSADKPRREMISENVSKGLDPTPVTDSTSPELPTDVRVKLKKLEKLESKYHELLKSYRIAHARIQTIDPFETTLREHTPLTSISDPSALVEYLNQVNLKNDMVVDELRRVTNDRDDHKRKLGEAERSAREAWDEVTDLKRAKGSDISHEQINDSRDVVEMGGQKLNESDPSGTDKKSPPASVKSPTTSLRGLSLFSPKLASTESPKFRQGSEDLFSYDGEIPRLESENKGKQDKIVSLTREVETLKGDLAVTRESTQSMVQTLEESTREVIALRDSRDRSDSDFKQQQDMLEQTLQKLRGELHHSEKNLEDVQAERSLRDDRIEDLSRQLQDARLELEGLHHASRHLHEERQKADELQKVTAELRENFQKAHDRNAELDAAHMTDVKQIEASQKRLTELEARLATVVSGKPNIGQADERVTLQQPLPTSGQDSLEALDANHSAKRKKNKKKKTSKLVSEEKESVGRVKGEILAIVGQSAIEPSTDSIEKLRKELDLVKTLIEEKDIAIENLGKKQKDQEGLEEEIETLRDDLLHVGQEHVEAKEQTKILLMEKEALEKQIAAQEAEMVKMQASAASGIASDKKHTEMAEDFAGLKNKVAGLQTDLSAAQQLASSRYKDLNDLRNVLQKAQPEIDKVRSEAAELKNVKDTLGKKVAEFKRLDSRHEEMRSELAGLRQDIANKETELALLSKRISQETSGRLKAEEANSKAVQEVQRLDTERRQATDSLDRLSKELARSREDLISSKARVRDAEQQLSKHRNEFAGLKEDVELKAAQYASAQSLMASMRDQTAEMAIQVREARERCESLDEEVAEAHRLLGERGREAETIRRLLADVEGGADARVREMKDRMETAIEERDRAEDDASTAGRRRARELEELRNKLRDVERSFKLAEEDRDQLQLAQRDWRRRREELELRVQQSNSEAEEVRKGMGQLGDALDEREKQAGNLEKQKSELRTAVEETQMRLDRLQKSNKVRFPHTAS